MGTLGLFSGKSPQTLFLGPGKPEYLWKSLNEVKGGDTDLELQTRGPRYFAFWSSPFLVDIRVIGDKLWGAARPVSWALGPS